MATLLKTCFSTDENAVAQADVKLMGSTVESLITECDQRKFEEFLLSGSDSPKATRRYCKVSSGIHSQVSSEIFSKVACIIAHNASSALSSEVLKTSLVAYMVCVNVSQETCRPVC